MRSAAAAGMGLRATAAVMDVADTLAGAARDAAVDAPAAPARASTWPLWSATARACDASCGAAPRCARSSRPTATATAPCPAPAPRWPAGPAGSRSPTPREALELREGGLVEVPLLVMGALDAGELERALSRGGGRRRLARGPGASCSRRRRRTRAREARHRHGPPGHPRGRAGRGVSWRRPARRPGSCWPA